MPALVNAFDAAVERWVARHHSPALDRVFFTLSSAADHSVLWFALGTLRAARRGDTRFATRFGLAMGLESAVTNGVLKTFAGRVRPARGIATRADGSLPYGMHNPVTSAFPSGHATAAFTAATILADGTSTGPLLFGLAGLVAASRVYVGLHHTSDAIAGTAVGLVFGQLLRHWVRSAPPPPGGIPAGAVGLPPSKSTGRFS